MCALQQAAGYPNCPTTSDDTGKVFTVSPKGYAAWGLSGPGSANTSTITFGSKTCPVPGSNPPATTRHRAPTGWNVPAYFSADCGSRWVVARDTGYDTLQYPAQLYPATDNRYVVGHDPAHQGGDIWATDAVLEIMGQEGDGWSGIFVTLPGVDKAAHMWGGVNDPGARRRLRPDDAHGGRHRDADAQVGKIMGELRTVASSTTRSSSSPPTTARSPRRGPLPRRLRAGERLRLLQLVLRLAGQRRAVPEPQEALQPLIDGTETAPGANVGFSYSDSSLNVWLKDQSPEKVAEAAAIMEGLADVTAVWRRDGDHFDRATPVRWDRMQAPRSGGSPRRRRSSSTPRPPTTVPT